MPDTVPCTVVPHCALATAGNEAARRNETKDRGVTMVSSIVMEKE